jgi:hypothetical protein
VSDESTNFLIREAKLEARREGFAFGVLTSFMVVVGVLFLARAWGLW